MRHATRWVAIGLAAAVCWLQPGSAGALSEVEILLDALVENGTLTAAKADQIRQAIAESREAATKQLAKEIVPEPARNWHWTGDIRLRHEYRNREGTGNDTTRQRIRLRYGVQAKVTDELNATVRLATGSTSDAVSTNQSFDVNMTKVALNLDAANLAYAPSVAGLAKVRLIGGIMENPFWAVSPLVLDPDLSFHGAAAQLAQEWGPVSVFTNQGVFVLDTDESESSSLWIVQGGASVAPFPDADAGVLKHLRLTGALAYEDYRNTFTAAGNKAGTDPLTRESQNTAAASDFNQLQPSLELASQIEEVPVAVYADWVHNASAGSATNDGFLVGLRINKARERFWSFRKGLNLNTGWEGGYYFQELEADAAYDEFVDSDFNDGGTNNRGHVFYVTLATLKNSTLGMKYFVARTLEGAKDVEDRVYMDWVTKF